MKILTRTDAQLNEYLRKHVLTSNHYTEIQVSGPYRNLVVWYEDEQTVNIVLDVSLPGFVMEDDDGNIFFMNRKYLAKVDECIARSVSI